MIVTSTDLALDDLQRLRAFVEDDRPTAAARLLERIIDATTLLAMFPLMGRAGEQAKTRELVVKRTPYIVIYRATTELVEVLRVIPGARLWPAEEEG